jgi:hypothetical protein
MMRTLDPSLAAGEKQGARPTAESTHAAGATPAARDANLAAGRLAATRIAGEATSSTGETPPSVATPAPSGGAAPDGKTTAGTPAATLIDHCLHAEMAIQDEVFRARQTIKRELGESGLPFRLIAESEGNRGLAIGEHMAKVYLGQRGSAAQQQQLQADVARRVAARFKEQLLVEAERYTDATTLIANLSVKGELLEAEGKAVGMCHKMRDVGLSQLAQRPPSDAPSIIATVETMIDKLVEGMKQTTARWLKGQDQLLADPERPFIGASSDSGFQLLGDGQTKQGGSHMGLNWSPRNQRLAQFRAAAHNAITYGLPDVIYVCADIAGSDDRAVFEKEWKTYFGAPF